MRPVLVAAVRTTIRRKASRNTRRLVAWTPTTADGCDMTQFVQYMALGSRRTDRPQAHAHGPTWDPQGLLRDEGTL